MICHRKFNLIAARPQANQDPGNVFITSPVQLSSNSAHLQNLSCNSGVVVPVRLLAIEELLPCAVGECEYNSPNYNGEECRFDHNQFAHLYVGTEIDGASVKHYIIAFVESARIDRYVELKDILCDTVKWLKIQNERPYFYIFYHGKQPAVGINLNGARDNLTRTLRSCLGNYKEDDRFCETAPVRTDTLNFTISGSNPYRFTVS